MDIDIITNQKKRIKTISLIMLFALLAMVIYETICLVNLCHHFVNLFPLGQSEVTDYDASNFINDYSIGKEVAKTIISVIYGVSLVMIITNFVRMVKYSLLSDCLGEAIEKNIRTVGICTLIMFVSALTWNVVVGKVDDGSVLLMLLAGMGFLMISEIIKLARIYKQDSDLSI